MRPVDLAEVINEAVDVVRPAADAKAIEVVTLLIKMGWSRENIALLMIWNLLTTRSNYAKRGKVAVQLERAGTYVRSLSAIRDQEFLQTFAYTDAFGKPILRKSAWPGAWGGYQLLPSREMRA
jgi:hypothetical protein